VNIQMKKKKFMSNPNIIKGMRYSAVVPDTLDLAARAGLALNAFLNIINPERLQPRTFIRYDVRTPYMSHHAADATLDPCFIQTLQFLRMMCGDDHGLELEERYRNRIIGDIDLDEGLYYNRWRPDKPWYTEYAETLYGGPSEEDFSNVSANGCLAQAMMNLRKFNDNPAWKERIYNVIRGLERTAIKRADYAYYPDGGVGEPGNYPRSGWRKLNESESDWKGGEGSMVTYHTEPIRALVRWYLEEGDSHALGTAGRLVRYCMKPRFWGAQVEPICVAGSEKGHVNAHWHAKALTLRAILDYGMAANDQRAIEFARDGYEFARTLGIPRLGWLATYPAITPYCETCALGDLIALGIRLSDAGTGNYWDDVDQVVRNHLAEVQFLDSDRLRRIAEASPVYNPELRHIPKFVDEALAGYEVVAPIEGYAALLAHGYHPWPGQEDAENVIERTVGLWGSLSSPSSIPNPWIMQCCTNGAALGLYASWEGILRGNENLTQVNLLLNRASSLLDINSFLPYEGKVELFIKAARRVAVRIPGWVKRNNLSCKVTGTVRPLMFSGNYLLVDDLQPGDTVIIMFPLVEWKGKYTALAHWWMCEVTYTITFRGSTVMDISPRDVGSMSYPLYLRDYLRTDKTPTKTICRFVPDRTILRW